MFKIKGAPTYDLNRVAKGIESKTKIFLENMSMDDMLKEQVLPDSFLDSPYYLMYPLLFNNAFQIRKGKFLTSLSIAGYFYFKYLLVVDAIYDQDSSNNHENNTSTDVLLLRSHVYNDEAHKILADLFGGDRTFWDFWNGRNKEFLGSLLLDKKYDPKLSLKTYEKLATGKCAFSKVVIDAFHSKKANQELYEALTASFDMFSVALCLQDDYQDFKKDLYHKKNNYAHVLISQWLETEKNQDFFSLNPFQLDTVLHSSGKAEQLIDLAISYHDRALDFIANYSDELGLYSHYIGSYRNKCNLIKVDLRSQRITKYVYQIDKQKQKTECSLNQAISKSRGYIEGLQSDNGAWYEVSNKQGLSDLWATGFISMLYPSESEAIEKARNYLQENKGASLWGYNVDWTEDYDTTTNVLCALNKGNKNIDNHLGAWLEGQGDQGGFGTYSGGNTELVQFLGFRKIKEVCGWTGEHVCVSALAYYFMSQLESTQEIKERKAHLSNYLLRHQEQSGVWQPYWWTSFIYPTYFAVLGMKEDKDIEQHYDLSNTYRYMMKNQNKDGSFSCDMLNEKSVFYSSMVLDLLAQDNQLLLRYKDQAVAICEWLLKNQYEDGSFVNSNFLAIPATTSKTRDASGEFEFDLKGGTQTITGEVAGLFSGVMAFRALTNYKNALEL